MLPDYFRLKTEIRNTSVTEFNKTNHVFANTSRQIGSKAMGAMPAATSGHFIIRTSFVFNSSHVCSP